MGTKSVAGATTARRYTPEEKARAVRLVRQLRKELGTTHGTIQRVADQIGCGVESLRTWVKQADVDEGEIGGDLVPGVPCSLINRGAQGQVIELQWSPCPFDERVRPAEQEVLADRVDVADI